MSYCRWSSDGFKSDVYVYEDVSGAWATHVCTSKKVGLDTLPPDPMAHYNEVGSDTWMEMYQKWHAAYDALTEWHQHTMPHAGDSFYHATPQECADNLKMLRGLGYHIPDGVIETLEEEQKELDNAEQPELPR